MLRSEVHATEQVGKARVRPQVVDFGIDFEIVEVESAVRVFLFEICKGPLVRVAQRELCQRQGIGRESSGN